MQPRPSCDVSIVIPTRDRPIFLREAVASALRALRGIVGEVIVVDDHSAVSAADALREMRDDRLQIHLNSRCSGASGSRNTGVDAAVGELIIFLDDDDLLLSGYINWILEMVDRDSSVAYGFSAIKRFSGLTHDFPPLEFCVAQGAYLSDLPITKRLAGLGCGFWIRRALYLELGGLDETLSVNEDTDFTISLVVRSVVGMYSPEAGVMVRTHASLPTGERASVTRSTSWLERAQYFERILSKHHSELLARDQLRRFLLFRLVKMIAKTGRHADVMRVIGLWGGAQSLRYWIYYAVQYMLGSLRAFVGRPWLA